MAANEGTSAGPNSPESYEAAVLDFLDKEMAAVQPVQNGSEQSDELNALVTDLLKQVITESDLPQSPQATEVNESSSLLAEFPPTEQEVLYSSSKAPESPAPEPAIPIAEPAPPIAQSKESRPGRRDSAADFVFAFPALSKGYTPKIVLASALLVILLGAGLYFFSGSKKNVSSASSDPADPQAAAAAMAANMTPAIPIAQTTPRYPELAVKSKAAATIVLELLIDEQGKVVKAIPITGPPLFHKEAVNAALRWRYKPATSNGANVATRTRVTMNFNPR
jgi:TonB family protein